MNKERKSIIITTFNKNIEKILSINKNKAYQKDGLLSGAKEYQQKNENL